MNRMLIDGSALHSSMKGVGRYSFHVIDQLDRKLGQNWELHVLVFDWQLPDLPFSDRVHLIRIPPCSDIYKGFVVIPLLCKRLQLDLLFTPMEAMIGFLRIPRMVVCHDISELIWRSQGQDLFSWRGLINHAQQWLRIRGLRKCGVVICNSEYVRSEVVSRYHIELARTLIGYCGIDKVFRRQPDFVPPAALMVAGQRIRPGYILAFATGDVRENPGLLPEVLALLKRVINPVHLVIAGTRPQGSTVTELARQFAALGLQAGMDYTFVRFLDESEIAVLAALYRNAALYLELSSQEGFGMQLAEAMASGIRCVSGRGGALPEIGGPHVTYFEDRSAPVIAEKVADLLRKPQDETALQAQLAFTNRYSWETTGSLIAQLVTAHSQE